MGGKHAFPSSPSYQIHVSLLTSPSWSRMEWSSILSISHSVCVSSFGGKTTLISLLLAFWCQESVWCSESAGSQRLSLLISFLPSFGNRQEICLILLFPFHLLPKKEEKRNRSEMLLLFSHTQILISCTHLSDSSDPPAQRLTWEIFSLTTVLLKLCVKCEAMSMWRKLGCCCRFWWWSSSWCRVKWNSTLVSHP